MNFHFDITLGQILTVVAILLGVLRFEFKWMRMVTWFLIEHEILVTDYCSRNGIAIEKLPTRTKKGL
jgi:hypothetical protein